MLVNGAPECIQINQMICLPFVPRTRTNYQATPDVLKATFYFYSHNTQYVQNKTTLHLASTTTYKIYNIHKLHQSAPPQASGRQDPRGCPLRGFNGLGKDNCKMRWEIHMFGYSMRLILDNWRYIFDIDYPRSYAMVLSVLQGPLLLTWFNFNPSMDK